jgi:hypothetical protein
MTLGLLNADHLSVVQVSLGISLLIVLDEFGGLRLSFVIELVHGHLGVHMLHLVTLVVEVALEGQMSRGGLVVDGVGRASEEARVGGCLGGLVLESIKFSLSLLNLVGI